nr:hypothetical protein [Bradyrhizobium cytisi]
MRDLECPDAPLDILERQEAQLCGLIAQMILHLIVDGPRNHDPAGASEFLKSGRNIDAVPVDIVVLGDDVADIGGHPYLQRVAPIR